MRKLYYFFVIGGKVLFVWMIMFILSISLYSLSIKGKVNYGNRCRVEMDDEVLARYSHEGIELVTSEIKCNTQYLEYRSLLSEKENSLFLVSLAKLMYDEKITLNVHVIIKCDGYQMISTIVDYNVSYTKSYI